MKKYYPQDPTLLILQEVGLEGRFKIETRKADSDKIELRAPWQDNLILNRGLDQLGVRAALSSWMYSCAVGSGSTPPAVTDTGLVSKVAQKDYSGSPQYGQSASAPYYGWVRMQYEFPIGAAAGVLSELGLKYYDNDNLMHTRALIKDSGGQPTSITVLSDEILIVTYEVRVYVDTTDKVTNTTVKGVPTVVTVRPASMTSNWFSYNGDIGFSGYVWGGPWYYDGAAPGVGPISGVPTGTPVYVSDVQKVNENYVPNSYQRIQQIKLTLQNLAGRTITGFAGSSAAINYQIGFAPGFAKLGTETVNLRVGTTWSRYTS